MNRNEIKDARIKYILEHPKLSNSQLAEPLDFANGESVRKFRKKNCLPSKQLHPSNDELESKIVKKTKTNGRTVEELADNLVVTEDEIENAIENLQSNHFIVNNFDGKIKMGKSIPHLPNVIMDDKWEEVEYSIGIISDTHLCSKWERLDILEELYDRFDSAGVDVVYLAGNWIEGEASFNESEIHTHGMREQVQYFVDNFPQRHGIKTYVLSGNDHESWYMQKTHINIGEYLEDTARRSGRDDIIDLGFMERDIEYKQPEGSSTLRVIHAGQGSSAATSIAAQKYVDALGEKERPSIVVIGHYHRLFYSNHRNIHLLQAGCTVELNPFARKNKLVHDIGGCIMHVKQNRQGKFTSVKVEFITFDDRERFEYKW